VASLICLIASTAAHLPFSQAAQFRIDQRGQFFQGRFVSIAPSQEQLLDFILGGRRHIKPPSDAEIDCAGGNLSQLVGTHWTRGLTGAAELFCRPWQFSAAIYALCRRRRKEMSQSRSPASIFFQALDAQDQITDINCRGKVMKYREINEHEAIAGITIWTSGNLLPQRRKL
jgi:hypothetical protein